MQMASLDDAYCNNPNKQNKTEMFDKILNGPLVLVIVGKGICNFTGE